MLGWRTRAAWTVRGTRIAPSIRPMVHASRLMHVMLNVADIDATLAFYARLGLSVQVDRSDAASGRRNLFLGIGGWEMPLSDKVSTPANAGAQVGDAGNREQPSTTSTLPIGPRPSPGWDLDGRAKGRTDQALIEISSESAEPAPQFGHIALAVDDVVKLCDELAAEGIPITRAPRQLASGTITAFIADPDGHAIELIQTPATVERLTIAHDGVHFPVIATGSGPALLMLHGGASRGDHFTGLMRALGGRFRTIAYDQRGFAGNDAGVNAVIDHERWAADVIGVLDGLGIDRAILLGWSMGASVAINAARRWPERITAIALLGAPDPGRQVDVAALRDRQRTSAALDATALRARDTRELSANLGAAARTDPALLARLLDERAATSPERTSRAIDGYASRPDLTAILPGIRCPSHILVGEEDRICPPAGARALAEYLPQATLDIVPGCGHYYAVERPQAVADILLQHLDGSTRA